MRSGARSAAAGLAVALCLMYGVVAAQTVTGPRCNRDEAETGARTVVSMQGSGTLQCGNFSGDTRECLNESCTMRPVAGFQSQVQIDGARRYINWSAAEPVDKILVSVPGSTQGTVARCLYDFLPGATAGSYLEPATPGTPTVIGCTDALGAPPPEDKPISTITNCEEALPSLQSSVDNDGNLLTVIGIGTDEGLAGEGNGTGDYILAVCSAGGQEQCVDECRAPTEQSYECDGGPGVKCLAERACATSDELPTGNEDAPKYCWEYSHQVDVETGTFVPPKEKESGSASWEQYSGSTCVKVTTSYRGRTYSYWSPAGCP